MTNNYENAFIELLQKAEEEPKKHCHVFWCGGNNNGLVIKGERVAIKRGLIIYNNGYHSIVANTANDENVKFHVVCKTKKHVAVMINKDKLYFDFFSDKKKSSEETVENNNSPATFICVAQTAENDTIIIAFVNGIYILETFDYAYNITLFNVIEKLTYINVKEESDNVEKEETSSQRPLLGKL